MVNDHPTRRAASTESGAGSPRDVLPFTVGRLRRGTCARGDDAESIAEEGCMRAVRKIGRRTWLTRTAGGVLAAWTGLKLAGRDGWAISLGMPAPSGARAEPLPAPDIHCVRLGEDGFVSSYIVVRGSEAAIVDTGVPGSAQRIGEVVQEAGVGWDAVRHLIVTHLHPDHAG